MIDGSMLAQIPVFDKLPQEDVALLMRMLCEETVPDGDVLMHEGEAGEFLVIVLEGELEIVKAMGTPDELSIAVPGVGEVVGEMGMINPEQGRVASVRARGPARVARLSRAQCELLVSRRPMLAFEMLRVVSERLRQTDDAIIRNLQQKNRQLQEAYGQLQEVQGRLLEQEQEERDRELALARYEHELRLARRIQQSMLPAQLPDLPGWQIAVRYQPAREVSGDFYDFLPARGRRLWMAVGDVTGKGVPAALVMATTRSTLRGVMQQAFSPAMALLQANELLCAEMPANVFVTSIVGLLDLDDGVLRYANAGHSLPFLSQAGNTLQLDATGVPLGLMPGMVYEEGVVTMQQGDELLLYSDGLLEARNLAGEMYGTQRIRQQLEADRVLYGAAQLSRMLDAVAAFAGPDWEQEDDITLLTVGSELD